MTRRSTYQRLALLAASTTVITSGALLPTSAFATPVAPHTAAVAPDGTATATGTGAAEAGGTGSVDRWTEATDKESGISARLPGQPETQRLDDEDGRAHQVQTPYGGIGFSVFDGGDFDLPGTLKENLDHYNKDSRSSDDVLRSEHVQKGTTDDGSPTLDADLVAADGTLGHTTYTVVKGHLLELYVIGTQDEVGTMQADYDQLMNSVRLPGDTAPPGDGTAPSGGDSAPPAGGTAPPPGDDTRST
ncbi:hypothetical protein [Streptomyces dangxiongensis]|uniref:hypothetical protein n=1 Tax=Streptomyces dangxiongensis TaxID=1442032 RepID=UPI0013CF12EC|nr:hypothetical protein [Streptomyces dangxiongensis]